MADDTTTPDASAIAEEAFVLAYPLVVTQRTMVQATAVAAPEPDTMRAPVNTMVQSRDTPDTLRVSGWLDLAEGPIVLSVPATHGRYYALWLRDAWTGVFASIGARTTGTASRAFVVVGPAWEGRALPAEPTPIAAPTRLVHIAGCIEAVVDSAHETRSYADDGFAMVPLSRWHCDPMSVGPSTVFDRDPLPPAEQIERMDARGFFAEVSRLVDDNPPDAGCRAALDRLRDIGAWRSPAPELRQSIERGVQAGCALIGAGMRTRPGGTSASWRFCSEFGRDSADTLRRARVAHSGIRPDPAIDVFDARVDHDADGRPLDGRFRYLLRFAPNVPPPVHGFWSLETCPGPRDGTHSIGDRRGLAMDADGSLPVYIQHRSPARQRKPNWLPAPRDAFTVALRLYWPRDEALQRRWSPPPVTRVK